MTDRFRYDSPALTRDEATELCVYHLRMATALYQLVPEDNNKAIRAEIIRQTEGDIDSIDRAPALAWALAMFKAYERLKRDD